MVVALGVFEHHGGMPQGEPVAGEERGDGSGCYPQGLQLTQPPGWGAAGASRRQDRGDTGFWDIPKMPWCLRSRRVPPEGTPSQGTQEFPARSIPSPRHCSHRPFATHPLLFCNPPSPGFAAMGGSSPGSPRGSYLPRWQQDPQHPRGCSPPARSGGQNQFAKHTQSLKSHWEQGGGTCHRS